MGRQKRSFHSPASQPLSLRCVNDTACKCLILIEVLAVAKLGSTISNVAFTKDIGSKRFRNKQGSEICTAGFHLPTDLLQFHARGRL